MPKISFRIMPAFRESISHVQTGAGRKPNRWVRTLGLVADGDRRLSWLLHDAISVAPLTLVTNYSKPKHAILTLLVTRFVVTRSLYPLPH